MIKKLQGKGRYKIKENVRYELRDKDGKLKQVFTENALGSYILRFFRKLNPHSISREGVVKPGILNHLAAYGLQIPFLTGNFGNFRLLSNLTTTAGKAGFASRLNGSGSEAAFTFIAVGIGTTAANIADTTLESEITDSGMARAAATASRTTTDTTNDTATLVKSFSVTGTKAVTESGVLNASSAGVLGCRQVFSALNVVNGDTLQITWNLDVD